MFDMSVSSAFVPLLPPSSFQGQKFPTQASKPSRLLLPHKANIVTAVAAKPPAKKPKKVKLSRVEGLKTASNQLRHPLPEQLQNDQIFINESAVQIMKFHGSYQQHDREHRVPGEKKYQFMLRLKMPAGDFPASLYQVLDDISTEHGNNTLRATTRCAWQIHGIIKGDLKPVFSKIMNAGGSCVGACGDLSRNVMCTPAPFTDNLYSHARFVSRMLGELFAPQTGAFSEIWLDGEKAASLEFWKTGLDMKKVDEIMRFDNGNGVVFQGKEEPIYGETYLPRKFKIGVTVPGDNSIDIYTQDIGIVCVPDKAGKVVGYNIIVGGGMGRMHKRDTTFARTGDHLGFVPADKLYEACKAIVATQRDHGNRTLRINARMKYLVHSMGIDAFRTLVEEYFGEAFEPYRELKAWRYEDWLGWHEQGDGKLFLGLFIENGRIKDTEHIKLRTALRRIIDVYGFDMVVSPNQNIILKNISVEQKTNVEAILKEHSVKLAEENHMNHRLAMACPAMPLCGLAVTEAERIMPSFVDRMNVLFEEHGIKVPITMRMTGCPNGCARPYMAELGFVGSGASMYQLWLGGCPNQTRLAWSYMDRAKEEDLEKILSPILTMYSRKQRDGEAFGDFCDRMGKAEIESFVREIDEKEVAVIDGNGKATAFKVSGDNVPKARITVARGATKITVIDGNGSVSSGKVEEKPVVQVESKDTGRGKKEEVEVTKVEVVKAEVVKAEVVEAVGAAVEEVKAEETKEATGGKKKRRAPGKTRPRLTVSNEIMERLKNIAALRDMSASNVADEIISTYLSGVEDEDFAMDI